MTSINQPATCLNTGVIVPIITPYHHADIFRVIDHIINGGVKALFLLGTTGEALKQNHQSKIKLIIDVANHIQKQAQLIVGITSQTLQQSVELMQTVDSLGVTASVIAPMVVDNDADHVLQTLMASSSGKLMLYNPPRLPKDKIIPLSIIKKYISEERILGIKDSSGDDEYFKTLLTYRGPQHHFKIFYGPERNLKEMLALDIDGFVPSSGNISPELVCQLWSLKDKGPWEKWNKIKDLINEKDEVVIRALKIILKDKGYITSDELFG
jgi:4-hydroxy-tetrahydrodipicolinate synthase